MIGRCSLLTLCPIHPSPPGYRITKLPPNGPKPGQSVSGWLYGKDKAHTRATEINQKP
jgi:hypothetical protein